jgi:hypothetical protein
MALIAAALFPALTACAAAPSPAVPSPAAVDDVRFEVMQGRTDYTNGTLVLRVINDGPADVSVEAATLTWDGFASTVEWDGGTTVAAGRTVDLRTDLPGMACDSASPSAPSLAVTLAPGNKNSGTPVTRTPDDPLGTLPRLHDTGCITVRVDQVVTIGLDGPLRVEGSGADAVAVLGLRLTATGDDGTVELTGVGSTPLLTPADGSESWPLSLTVDAASAVQSVDLFIRPARCDSHAIAEDKIGTVLVLAGRVNGVDGAYRYAVDDTTRQALYAYVKAVCGMP